LTRPLWTGKDCFSDTLLEMEVGTELLEWPASAKHFASTSFSG